MALKDWKSMRRKKTFANEIAYFENKNGVSFVAIFIQQDGSYLVDSSGFEPDYVNKFNTKSEAIKFAKAYMRWH